jgi:hypothetical protein
MTMCRYKAAAYGELEKRSERQERLLSMAMDMGLKKELMVPPPLPNSLPYFLQPPTKQRAHNSVCGIPYVQPGNPTCVWLTG